MHVVLTVIVCMSLSLSLSIQTAGWPSSTKLLDKGGGNMFPVRNGVNKTPQLSHVSSRLT